MKAYEFGTPGSDTVLVQPVDRYDLENIEKEVLLISEYSGRNFRLIAAEAEDWNRDLSPWNAPAVFGAEDFGGGAAETLGAILELCPSVQGRSYYIGGYSLAGLFALWAAFRTDMFRGVAAASPSVWFPGLCDYIRENTIKTESIYLSLGDREEKTRNPVMATVGARIKDVYGLLRERNVNCVLEWNEGNHFRDAHIRTAKAFSWVIGNN